MTSDLLNVGALLKEVGQISKRDMQRHIELTCRPPVTEHRRR